MALLLPDIDRVTRIVRSVADDLVVPRFRRLRSDDIQSKPTPGHADDVVMWQTGRRRPASPRNCARWCPLRT
jgi:hypothetical protein